MVMPAQMEAIAEEQMQDRERTRQCDSLVTRAHSSDDSFWRRPISTVLKVEHSLVQWLVRDYHRRSLHRALKVAYTSFARLHPQWVASLFDRHFVYHHLLPMLVTASERGTPVTPEDVAERYAAQISCLPTSRARYCAEVMPAAAYFLHLVAAALEDARMTTPSLGIQFASHDLPVLS
jgi:hypothetical protein